MNGRNVRQFKVTYRIELLLVESSNEENDVRAENLRKSIVVTERISNHGNEFVRW